MGGSTFIQVWTVLPEYCEPFSMWGFPSPCTSRTLEMCFKQDLRIWIWLVNVKHTMIRSYLICLFSFSNRDIKSTYFQKQRLNHSMSTKHTHNTAYHTLNYSYHTYLLMLMMLFQTSVHIASKFGTKPFQHCLHFIGEWIKSPLIMN